jgi:hypothetical protein
VNISSRVALANMPQIDLILGSTILAVLFATMISGFIVGVG